MKNDFIKHPSREIQRALLGKAVLWGLIWSTALIFIPIILEGLFDVNFFAIRRPLENLNYVVIFIVNLLISPLFIAIFFFTLIWIAKKLYDHSAFQHEGSSDIVFAIASFAVFILLAITFGIYLLISNASLKDGLENSDLYLLLTYAVFYYIFAYFVWDWIWEGHYQKQLEALSPDIPISE